MNDDEARAVGYSSPLAGRGRDPPPQARYTESPWINPWITGELERTKEEMTERLLTEKFFCQ
jgi:hypothetical protein